VTVLDPQAAIANRQAVVDAPDGHGSSRLDRRERGPAGDRCQGRFRGWAGAAFRCGPGDRSTDFLVKPKVRSFAPPSGPVCTVVTFTGSAFTGSTKVMFTGDKGKILTVAYGQITVRVLAGTVTGPITVVTPSGKSTSKKSFTVT